MARYVDKDVLINEFDQTFLGNNPRGVIRATIEYAPTADVVEVRHGKWESTYYTDYDDTYECSVCGEAWTFIDGTPKDNGANYCPHCGAKMDGDYGEIH